MLSSFHLVLFSSRQRLQGRLILPGTLTGDALFELVPSAVVVAVAAAAASALLRTPCGDPSPAPVSSEMESRSCRLAAVDWTRLGISRDRARFPQAGRRRRSGSTCRMLVSARHVMMRSATRGGDLAHRCLHQLRLRRTLRRFSIEALGHGHRDAGNEA